MHWVLQKTRKALPLKMCDRLEYVSIKDRQSYAWPNGSKLAVFLALNVEIFTFDDESNIGLIGEQPAPYVAAYGWKEYGNRYTAHHYTINVAPWFDLWLVISGRKHGSLSTEKSAGYHQSCHLDTMPLRSAVDVDRQAMDFPDAQYTCREVERW